MPDPADSPATIAAPLGSDEIHRRSSRSRRRWWTAIAAAVVLELLVAGAVVAHLADDDGEGGGPNVYTYVVPAGTGQRLQAGEQVLIIPAELQLAVGDRIVVVNHDDRTHAVGPFSVRAGETIGHTFSEAGDFTGICTVHPYGKIEIHVA